MPVRERGENEREARQIERSQGSNGQAEDDCKDDRTEDAGESCDAAVSPLKLALLRRLHATAHKALQGWPCKPDGGKDEDCGRASDLVVCEPPRQ